jgi:1L-myo-inositol 1-phosphate cytidylyltransferase / CDP-L-myo-inositol myo-inositolphosphotransferase
VSERVDSPAPFDGVILVTDGAEHVVGGLRLLERAAFVLIRAGARRLFCIGPRPPGQLRLPLVPIAWLDSSSDDSADWRQHAADRIVILGATTIVDPATVAALATTLGPACLAIAPPATLWRDDRHVLETRPAGVVKTPPDARRWQPPPTALVRVADDAPSRRDAEEALYERLGRSGDGWFTRVIDRRFSRFITRRLLPTAISPNQVTIVSILIGIAGGCCFATGRPEIAALGAILFLASTIIDGCDGEIARLTFRESVFGARLDILGDNLVHLFLFGGIAGGLYRRSADPGIAALGLGLVVGVLFAMVTVYCCIVRREPNAAQRTLYEAFASREFAYLLVMLTLLGRLDWFLWLSALGTYAFSIGLWVLGRSGEPA